MTRKRRPTLWRNAEDQPTTESLTQGIVRHIQSSLAKDEFSATELDKFQATCLALRDAMVERWVNTQQTYYQANARRVYYISMEYLMGRALHNAAVNMGSLPPLQEAMKNLGFSLADLEELESDAGLGNGGLGRLAACFLDSIATLGLPGYGYGLRYDYGIFRQRIEGGEQVEHPDDWLRLGNPWEFPRPEYRYTVKFGGRVELRETERKGRHYAWIETHDVLAMPYDTPVPGYGTNTVNTLRLWRALPVEEFDLDDFNAGDYTGAVERRVESENITRVLYPNDNIHLGKVLRLKQQYFLVAATLHDAIRRHLRTNPSLDNLAEKVVFQLNDTHPALAVAELMRLLLDEYDYGWDQAWRITRGCMAYTNHTLLPEALEKWRAELLGQLLPRHLMLINEINRRFLDEVRRRFPGDDGLVRRVSIYEEGQAKRVRMAHLAVVGSHSVNGVAELHTELLKTRVLADFHRIWPDRFNNKTNGVTQRRWLLSCNPWLAETITRRVGGAWATNLDHLRRLEEWADDEEVQGEFAAAKQQAKDRLAHFVSWRFGENLDSASVFDVQIKRIHEYKRQLLNVLHIVHLYCRLQREPELLKQPRTFIFAGKAAPGYAMAKLIIRLIHGVAEVVNNTPGVSERLRVCFVPNYDVSKGELLFPAAEVSEQISTAGFEASGTGNMKFALNGALTLGTLDGANIEIDRDVGRENLFIFGLTVDEVARLRQEGYDPRAVYQRDDNVREVIDLIAEGRFSGGDPGLFRPIVDALLERDHYLHLADFEAYRKAHLELDAAYADRPGWLHRSVLNTARTGNFSSDRTIRDYVRDIWKVRSYEVEVE